MSVEEAVRTKLTATSAVTTLISTRIYPLYLPPDTTLPAVAYERVSTRRSYAHNGQQAPTTARLQFDAIATTLASAMAVGDAIRGALSGYTGTSAGVKIASCLLANELSQDEKDTGYARVSQDYLVTFMEV